MTTPPHASPADPVIRFRPARAEDVPAILRVVQAAYRGEGGWTTEAHLVRGERADAGDVHELLRDPAVVLLVAVQDTPAAGVQHTTAVGPGSFPSGDAVPGRIVGCVYTRRSGETAELGLFAVDPHVQAGGIGGRLLEAQAELLAASGVRSLMIQVLQSRPELHAWYERRGFRKTGRVLPFPVDPALLKDPGLQMDEMVRSL